VSPLQSRHCSDGAFHQPCSCRARQGNTPAIVRKTPHFVAPWRVCSVSAIAAPRYSSPFSSLSSHRAPTGGKGCCFPSPAASNKACLRIIRVVCPPREYRGQDSGGLGAARFLLAPALYALLQATPPSLALRSVNVPRRGE
jgi:hypothetical protein